MDTTRFRFALAGYVADRFDARRNPPARYHLAVTAVCAMAEILPDPLLDTYMKAVLDGLAKDDQHRGGPLPGLGFVRYFDGALCRAIGDLDDRGDGFHEAWHIVLLLRSILPGGELAAFVECVQDALDQAPSAPELAEERQPLAAGHPAS
ncbi:hypothetical protein AB0F71_31250 [Kitasatospora sp. NPDC028055]|uniref:hypothetical protein n=1 Tax=Kitasatospora sp. NPDC028055 TaxID=3155653 RepID=UPI0033DD7C4D